MKSLLSARMKRRSARLTAPKASRNYSPLPLRFRGTPDITFLDLKIPLAAVPPPARPIAPGRAVAAESNQYKADRLTTTVGGLTMNGGKL